MLKLLLFCSKRLQIPLKSDFILSMCELIVGGKDGLQPVEKTIIDRSVRMVYQDYLADPVPEKMPTESFPKLLKANGLRHIRYHDLRHSCASLLLANGVPMKQIQEWLGHSDFSTTANIYAHLDYSSKLTSADAMLNGLGLVPN